MSGLRGEIDEIADAADVWVEGLEGEIEVDGPGVVEDVGCGVEKGGVG